MSLPKRPTFNPPLKREPVPAARDSLLETEMVPCTFSKDKPRKCLGSLKSECKSNKPKKKGKDSNTLNL